MTRHRSAFERLDRELHFLRVALQASGPVPVLPKDLPFVLSLGRTRLGILCWQPTNRDAVAQAITELEQRLAALPRQDD